MAALALLHHALLLLAIGCLGATGIRLASPLAPDGLERILAAAAIAAAAAAFEAIVLGLADLGGETWALAPAALVTYAAARARVPAPELGPGAELKAWLGTAPPVVVLALGAAAGVVLAWIAWQLRHPLIGPDALTYHLPIASAWVQNGRPGSLVGVMNGEPFGNYPLTNEVLVAWALGISRSWAWVSVWSPVLLVGVGLGAWVALRELGVGTLERGLAVVALAVPPLMIGQLGAPYTDIAALAWLAVAAGLATASRRRPGLIYPAVLAAALCVGTKTTPAVLILGLAAVAWVPLRAASRRWLLGAVGVGVVIGGVWSVRNLIDHGSPLWPLLSAPWGTPIPAAFRPLEGRFLDHPRHLVGAYWRDYLSVLGGSAVLIGSGIVCPLVRRTRAALLSAMAAVVSLVAWGVAPYTGVLQFGAVGAIANLRYLLPAIGACTVALCVSSVGAGRTLRLVVRAGLVGSIGYSVVRTAAFGPLRPSLATLLVAAVAGAGAAGLARHGRPGVDGRIVAGALGLVGAVGLAVGAHGYVGRFVRANAPPNRSLYAVPAIRDATGPIASVPGEFVMLRGDRLQHPLALIGAGESCASVRARLHRGPVVLGPGSTLLACLRGRRPAASDPYGVVYTDWF